MTATQSFLPVFDNARERLIEKGVLTLMPQQRSQSILM